MKIRVFRNPVKIIAGYMAFTLFMSPAFSNCVFAGERLEDFSAMIKDIDAEAMSPEETQDMDTGKVPETKPAAKTETAPKSETAPKAETAPKYESAPKVEYSSKSDSSSKAGHSGSSGSAKSDLKLTAGAARYMEDAPAKTEQTKAEQTKTEQAKTQRTDGEEPDERLVEFAALAGTQEGGAEDERLAEFAAIANIGDGSEEDARLQEFAALAGTEEDDIEDSRMVELASISDGLGGDDIADTRMVSLAKANDEREAKLTEKYGPVIEDHVVSDPSKYNDGDKVVTSSKDYPAGDRVITDARDYNDGDRVIATAKAHYTTDRKATTSSKVKSDNGKAKTSENTEEKKSESKSGFSKRLDSARSFFRGLFTKKDKNNDDNGGFGAPDSYDGEKQSLGYFNLTAYDACILCCGKTDGITATGTKAQTGRTIAVDPAVIPYGSKVMINDHIYVAEDTGSKINGNTIDIFMSTHEEAKRFGRKTAEVFLLK